DELHVLRVDVVRVVCGLVGELHRETKIVVVLLRHLPQLLELFNAGDFRQDQRIAQERLLFGRAGRMLQDEDDAVTDHCACSPNATASLAAMAVMLTIPRLVVEGARMWAGARVPIRMGPTASALFISLSRVMERLALSRLGNNSR